MDELHSWDIKGDLMSGKSGVTRSIVDQLHSSDIKVYQMEREGGFTRSIIH